MRDDVKLILDQSGCFAMFNAINRDILYGSGFYSDYEGGLIFKWGDGYSRKHIWVKAENDLLEFEVQHYRKCSNPACQNDKHVYTRDQWSNRDLMKQEILERFSQPINEATED